jgi:hypothetical protein
MKSNAKYRYNIDETKNDKWFGNLRPDNIVNPDFFTKNNGLDKIKKIIDELNQPTEYHKPEQGKGQEQGQGLSLKNPAPGGSKRKNKRSKKYSLRRNKLRKTHKNKKRNHKKTI